MESSDDMLVSFFSVCIKSCHLFRDLYVVVRLQKTNSRTNFFFSGHGLPTADKNGIYKKEFGENSSSWPPLHICIQSLRVAGYIYMRMYIKELGNPLKRQKKPPVFFFFKQTAKN